MICHIGGTVLTGRAIDLPAHDAAHAAALDPATVATAIRTGRATAADGAVVDVEARAAGSLHERVGCVASDTTLRPRTALAVAARSRGWTTPVDDRLEATRDRLASHTAAGDPPETAEYRRAVTEATGDVDRLRERAAEARGRIQAGADGDRTGATDDDLTGETGGNGGDGPLAEAIRELSEAETVAAAAREQHRRAREAARERRDRLQERLGLADEVANLERAARRHLVERARAPYEGALAAVPGVSDVGDPFAAAPDAMALAIARLGEVAAPVVVATGRFDSAGGAARWLGAPVVRL